MTLRLFLGFLSVVLVAQAQAFPCYITIVKDSCWKDYDVSIKVEDVMSEKPITNILIPSGESWKRYEFSCKEKLTIQLKATFSPVIWETDQDKSYLSKSFLSFPDEIKPGQTAWNMTVCYPGQFEGVPTPPDVSAGCRCDTKSIPPVAKR